MESINSLSGGMNSDISKQLHSKDSYLQALNFRGLTELGGSNGSLVNIKGNECKLTFPDLQSVYKLIVVEGETSTNSNDLTITINGVTASSVLTITNNTTGFEIYNFIITKFTNCYQNSATATKTFAVAYDNNYVIIYQQPVYQDCTTVASVPTVITITYSNATSGAFPTLKFDNGGVVANSITQNTTDPYVKGCTGSLIVPIGSTWILNDIYILTAPDTGTIIPPNDELQYNGAIWKLNIDDITKQHTLTLVYSNNLDFTKYHPIPPSAITGRYESQEIQRIYWSDNYNKIRTLNVGIQQLMALKPTLLSITPKVEMTQGILNSIGTPGSGNLSAGCWQMAYRLSKILGSVTNFSETSNPVYLNTCDEDPNVTEFKEYFGAAGAANKSITWHLTNLDTSFDQIEFVAIFRGNAYAVPEIKSVGLRNITQDMDFTYSDTSNSNYTDITLEEFLLFNGTFTHAKTCDTKDNRLFWGNVRAPRKELEIFDARAFRSFDGTIDDIRLTNDSINDSYTLTEAQDSPQTDDCINEYYDSDGNYSTNACYLKPGSSTILGGQGINISYEFGTELFELDKRARPEGQFTEQWDLFNYYQGSPYRETVTNPVAPTDLVYNYPQNNAYHAMKQPYRTSLLKGFQHEEIYRFGIQFFDLEQNPYFTKWIGDIKMPSYGDYNNNPGGSVSDFRLSYYNGGSNELFGQILYIKFDVDVTRIQDIISGYQIVRVDRDGTNRTIWGCGMVNPMMSTNGDQLGGTVSLPAGFSSERRSFIGVDQRAYCPFPSQDAIECLNIDYDGPALNANFGKFKTFDCFDTDLGLRPSYSTADKLLIRGRVESINWKNGQGGYRQFGPAKSNGAGGANRPADNQSLDDTTITPPYITKCNNDSGYIPFFIMKMTWNTSFCAYTDFRSPNTNPHDYSLLESIYMTGNGGPYNASDPLVGSQNIYNKGIDAPVSISASGDPCGGKQTLLTIVGPNDAGNADTLFTTSGNGIGPDYGCRTASNPFYKLIALYYKPNNSQYGGNTYVSRTNNEYIPCGEYIPVIYNDILIPTNIISSYKTFGGDVFTLSYGMAKTFKLPSYQGSEYHVFKYDGNNVLQGTENTNAQFSTSFFFPCTSYYNAEMRLGKHINRSLEGMVLSGPSPTTYAGGYGEDEYSYESYNHTPNNIKTYYPKPLNFQTSEEWNNRIYWSEIKFNNETQDSWSVYLTDNFYDVEGNYGPINTLVSLKENMYYIQERGVGVLMINPVSLINDQMGQPIKLGGGNATGTDRVIQKHYYKAIDTGTSHQWSVYRSQSAISFVDARHKKIYLFNGESALPISDVKGQRNFVIKRLHNLILTNDNPVINKGILTTYDYYHNEFLYTFNNVDNDATQDENLTLAFSEVSNDFTGMYVFAPNLYINNNKYLLSTNRTNKLWFHNYGQYGSFYGTTYPSNLKVILNDNPLYTKIFDNITWNSESVNDNLEWNDDFNLYPGASTNPLYVDDVNNQSDTFTKLRCYNDWQNSDWINLSTIRPNNNLTRKERNFNIQVPRNKFNYDVAMPSVSSLFNPTYLTKVTFGERLRDKYLIVDLEYPNTSGNRFVIHNLKTQYRISDR